MGHAAPRHRYLPSPDVRIALSQIDPCLKRLDAFIRRYRPLLPRHEHRSHFRVVLEGLLSDLPRKTLEPIAIDHDKVRDGIQRFVGAGCWDDEALLARYHREVFVELGDPQGILVIDPSAFPKKGVHSVGVHRQWCGRLGKIENCQLGVFLGYVGRGTSVLLNRRLFLPRPWCRSPQRRRKTRIPQDVRYQTVGQIADDLLRRHAPMFPHAWIVGDDEIGRPSWFRRNLHRRGERYILEVPCNTSVRDLESPPPKPIHRRGKKPSKTPFVQAAVWAQVQPKSRWTRVTVRAAENGPLEVEALRVSVQTMQRFRLGLHETLVVFRSPGSQLDYSYWLTNAAPDVPLAELVRAAKARHHIEECFQRAKGETGLDQYEVRSWVGWHHHTALSLLATWFLTLERRRVGGKNPRDFCAVDRCGLSGVVA